MVEPSPEELLRLRWKQNAPKWKGRALSWLKQHCELTDGDLELCTCVKRLLTDPNSREAALALFWNAYLPSDGTSALSESDLTQLEQIMRIPPDDVSQKEVRAEISLLLAATMVAATMSPENCSIAENPRAIGAVEKALEIYLFTRPEFAIGEDEIWSWGEKWFEEDLFQYSRVLANGIIFVEGALWRRHQGKPEEAFDLITAGVLHLTLAAGAFVEDPSLPKQNMIPNAEPYIPHLGGRFDAQEAADAFESLKNNPSQERDWKKVSANCRRLQQLAWRQKILDVDDWVTDSEGNEWDGAEYFPRAAAFAECQLSPSQLVAYQREKEKEQAEKRLERDFFELLWQRLEPVTKDRLVQAELHWEQGQLGDMVEDYRFALEEELPAIVPPLKAACDDKEHLPLTTMASFLEGNIMVMAWMVSKLGKVDMAFLSKDLPLLLKKVVRARNDFTHRNDLTAPGREERAKEVRRRLLGIQCEKGFFIRIAEIKEKLAKH